MASWRFPRVDVVGVCAPFRGVDDPFLLRWMIVQKGLAFRLDETLKNLKWVTQCWTVARVSREIFFSP
jgi:hypothetical protein